MYCLWPLCRKLHRLCCSSKCVFWSRIQFWILVPSLITWLTLKFREVKLLLIFFRYKPKVISILLSLCENYMIKYKVKVRHTVNKLSMIGVVFKIVFVSLFPTLPLDLSFYIDFMHWCLVSVWPQPLWLKEGEAAAIFYCQVWIIPFISYQGEYQDEGQRPSPFSPHYHRSLSACLFSPLLPSFIFLPLLLQKCWHQHLCAVWKASKDWGISRCRKWERKFWLRNLPISNRNECDIQELSAHWQAVKAIHT